MQVGNLIRPLPLSRQFVRDPSLVLYLPLYRLDGQAFTSADAYGHLITATGALWTPQGRTFDGVDDYIDCGSPSINKVAGTLEINLAPSIAIASATSLWDIVGLGADASNRFALWLDNVTDELTFSVIGGASVIKKVISWAANERHHITATWSGSGVFLYIDGVLVDSNVTYTQFAGTVTTSQIGKYPYASASFYPGLVGEVRLYSRAPGVTEIMQHYLATKWRYTGGGNKTIDVGNPAIDRVSAVVAGSTIIDLANPVNEDGNIYVADFWFVTGGGNATGVKIGMFHLVSGLTYICKQAVTIGNVTAGAKETVMGFTLPCEVGDYIGIYYDAGQIEQDSAGPTGYVYKTGDFVTVGSQQLYTDGPNGRISVYGSGY